MNWKNVTIGKKIAIGFGTMISLLITIWLLSFSGLENILQDADQVIEGDRLDATLAQKEVDHLNWASKVSALLTSDNVTKLDVETDDHKCGFGRWLYGDERKHTEQKLPTLAPLLQKIEDSHGRLHQSAIEIGKSFKYADVRLPNVLAQREVDHLEWAAGIRDTFIHKDDSLDAQADPTKCALGKWLTSEQAKKAYERGDDGFRKVWDKMAANHEKLHQTALMIKENLAFSKLAKAEETKKKVLAEWEKSTTELHLTALTIRERIAENKAAEEQAMKKQALPKSEKNSHEPNDLLEMIMQPAAGPTENEKLKLEDAPQISKWNALDTHFNEQVIQPFLEAEIALATLEVKIRPQRGRL